MHIAYVGNFRHSHCTEVHVKASLEALGHRVLPLQENTVSWATVPRLIKQRSVDMLLWTRTWGDGGAAAKPLQQLRDAGVPTVSFHLDRWWGLDRQYQLNEEQFFRTDLVVTAERGHEDDWADKGIRHAWLPPGVFHVECEPVDPDRERFPHEIVFVGSHPYPHPAWEPHRTAVIDAVTERYGDRFGVYPRDNGGHALRGRDLQTLYASAKVVVGDSCLLGGVTHYWSDRIPETLGRGGVLVHPDVEGLNDWYLPFGDLVTYPLGDVDRLLQYVDDLLDDDGLRRIYSERGRQTVLDRDTYVHRMTTVLEWVDDLKAARPLRKFIPTLADVTTDELLDKLTGPYDRGVQIAPLILRSPVEQSHVETTEGCHDCVNVGLHRVRCAICDEPVVSVLCLGDAPIANRLRDNAAAAVERHPLHVVQCVDCGTVQLASRPAAETLFDSDYPYRSSQSRTMLASASRLAQYMTTALQLTGQDLVLEVGSNDGYLLKHYQRLGARVVGFDPAREAAADAIEAGVDTYVQFFDSKTGDAWRDQAAVVHANNVLAHVDDPNDLLAGMAAALRIQGVLVIETPWLMPMLDDGAFDTIYHEHRFYWSVHALDQLLRRHGFGVMGVEQHMRLHGGTLRVFAEQADSRCVEWEHLLAVERRAGLEEADWRRRYDIIHRGQVEKLRRWWQGVNPVAGYGAAAKGAIMLHVLEAGGDIRAPQWVVDSTAAKQGKYTPTGSLVLPPDELAERMPSDCVIFPWNFADEIARRAAQYVEQGGKLWTLVPDVRRVA